MAIARIEAKTKRNVAPDYISGTLIEILTERYKAECLAESEDKNSNLYTRTRTAKYFLNHGQDIELCVSSKHDQRNRKETLIMQASDGLLIAILAFLIEDRLTGDQISFKKAISL